MKFRDKLKKLDACYIAVKWVGERTAKQAWAECDRSSWMMWLLAKMVGKQGWPSHKTVVGIACDCAETALHLVLAVDNRPRIAIETTRKWIDGEASEENVRDAARAALAAARFTARAAACDAAYAAAYAAYAAYADAYFYNDASRTAESAVYAVGGDHTSKLADMIRSKVPTIPEVE